MDGLLFFVCFVVRSVWRLETEVSKGMVVYIPRGSRHEIICTTEEDLVYIFVAVWPGGIPQDQKEWRKVYKEATIEKP